jgi:hypothetical protein
MEIDLSPFNTIETSVFYAKTKYRASRYYLKYCFPNRINLKKTAALRNTKKDKSAFVFGNGPSMKKLDSEKVLKYIDQGMDVFGTNSYLFSEFGKTVLPSHYLLSDPLWFDTDEASSISSSFRSEILNSNSLIAEHKPTLFIPIDKIHYSFGTQTFYFNDVENMFSSNVVDILSPRGYLSNAGHKAIAIAGFLGYKKIYVCGLDNSRFKDIHVDRDNISSVELSHFFENRTERQSVKRNRSVARNLFMAYLTFKDLEKFQKFPICNLDPESLVDAFPKYHALDIYKPEYEL